MTTNEAKKPEAGTDLAGRLEPLVSCVRATKLVRGCIVMMSKNSGLVGYGNGQCVLEVNEPLGVVSLFGHNQHYKISDVERILEYPFVPANAKVSRDAD